MLVVGAALVAGDLVVVKAAVVVAGLNPRSFTSWPKSNPSFPSAVMSFPSLMTLTMTI